MSDPTRMTAAALADALASGDLSSEQITRAHLDRIEGVDEQVGAYLHVAGESALAEARARRTSLLKRLAAASPGLGMTLVLPDMKGGKTLATALGEIKAVDDHQTDRVERGHHGQKHLVSVGGGEADREVGDGVDTDEPADEPQHLAREGASLRQFEPEQHEQ